ncbi:MAG: hypothetical protein RLZZ210_935 [Pseudomonadota bacterium]|jgi:hypothetical protein
MSNHIPFTKPEDKENYNNSIKYYRDAHNVAETAKIEKSIEIAKKMKLCNLPTQDIIECTGLTEEEIKNI